MNWAAAIAPPIVAVYWRRRRACSGVQTSDASRVPALVANEVTIFAFAALEKSITPFHCSRVRTEPNPLGGFRGGGASGIVEVHTVRPCPAHSHVAEPSAAASLRRGGFAVSIGGLYSYSDVSIPVGVELGCSGFATALELLSHSLYGFQNLPPVTSTISTLYNSKRSSVLPIRPRFARVNVRILSPFL